MRSLFVLMVLVASMVQADWPGWRGPTHDGVSTAKDVPLTWSATENVRWKSAIPGIGASAPIVSGERVVVTSSGGRAGEELYLLCHHLRDGKLLWQRRFFGSELSDGQWNQGSMAIPTPTTDGKHFFALYGTGDLVCVDLDGKPVWIRSLAREYGAFRNRWGMASSPLLIDGLLVVQVDHWTGGYLLGLDATTGKNRWRTSRGFGINWTSPVVMRVGERKLIIAAGTNTLKAYDAATGQEQWSLPGLLPQCIPTPVVRGDRLWLTSGGTFSCLCVQVREEAGKCVPHVVWKVSSKGTEIPSPVLVGEHLYYAEDAGFVTCLRADTGERAWKGRLGAKVQASPVAVSNRLYFASVNGTMTVLAAGGAMQVLARNDIGEALVASPAVVPGGMVLRGERHLFCVGGK